MWTARFALTSGSFCLETVRYLLHCILHYLFYQTPDFLCVVLQITNLSNNMLILQLQSIATTSCNLKLS